MANPFLTLQNTLKTVLSGVSGLAACPILTEDPGDPLNTAYLALYQGALPVNAAGKTGIAAVIALWDGNSADANNQISLTMMRLGIRISVFENIPVNRDANVGTGLSGLDATHLIIQNIHGFSFNTGQTPVAFVRFDTDSSPTEPILAWFIDFELITAIS
jgi:hypothetical protein